MLSDNIDGDNNNNNNNNNNDNNNNNNNIDVDDEEKQEFSIQYGIRKQTPYLRRQAGSSDSVR